MPDNRIIVRQGKLLIPNWVNGKIAIQRLDQDPCCDLGACCVPPSMGITCQNMASLEDCLAAGGYSFTPNATCEQVECTSSCPYNCLNGLAPAAWQVDITLAPRDDGLCCFVGYPTYRLYEILIPTLSVVAPFYSTCTWKFDLASTPLYRWQNCTGGGCGNPSGFCYPTWYYPTLGGAEHSLYVSIAHDVWYITINGNGLSRTCEQPHTYGTSCLSSFGCSSMDMSGCGVGMSSALATPIPIPPGFASRAQIVVPGTQTTIEAPCSGCGTRGRRIVEAWPDIL